jgi:hypothetical protein
MKYLGVGLNIAHDFLFFQKGLGEVPRDFGRHRRRFIIPTSQK